MAAKPINTFLSASHFAAYDYSAHGWRRTGVWKVEAEDADNIYFRSLSGGMTHKRRRDQCARVTFRPFVFIGGKRAS
jgi:hypothetical protein